MKTLVSLFAVLLILIGCSNSKTIAAKEPSSKTTDTIRIANEELEYEILIFDPGFNSWLMGKAKPRGFYSETYLEGKNQLYVAEWNIRASQPQRFGDDLYPMRIDYDPSIRYGYEVNYMLYNYFIYFQINYNQRLGGFVPFP